MTAHHAHGGSTWVDQSTNSPDTITLSTNNDNLDDDLNMPPLENAGVALDMPPLENAGTVTKPHFDATNEAASLVDTQFQDTEDQPYAQVTPPPSP